MQKSRKWLALALVVFSLGSAATVVEFSSSSNAQTQRARERRADRSYWRNYDGRWNYWSQPDKRWYYTDGSNWYYSDHDKWNVYRFDKDFGKTDFERGDYKVPGADVKVELPRHKVYVER